MAVCILEIDPDLGHGIPPERMEAARRACQAETVEVRQGEWDPEASTAAPVRE